MKSRIFTLLTTLALITTFAIPAFAASSSYTFTMDHRYVSGKNTGTYHDLDSGDADITGSAWIYNSHDYAVGDGNDIHYQLCRDVAILPDKCFGSINGGIDQEFSGTYDDLDKDADDYYLVIWKSADDGHDVSGSGRITQ